MCTGTRRSAPQKRYFNTTYRSRLSFLSGQRLYLVGNSEAVDFMSSSFEQLVQDVDALIGDPQAGAACIRRPATQTGLPDPVQRHAAAKGPRYGSEVLDQALRIKLRR